MTTPIVNTHVHVPPNFSAFLDWLQPRSASGTVVETMQLGGVAGLTALTMGLGQEHANKEKEIEVKKQE